MSDTPLQVYFSEAALMAKLFLSNNSFDTSCLGWENITAAGLSHISQEPSYSDQPLRQRLIANQWLRLCHKHSIVLTDSSCEYHKGVPIVLCSETIKDTGSLRLWVPSRTHTLQLQEDFDLPLAESTVVEQHGVDGVPKFVLSPTLLMNNMKNAPMPSVLVIDPLNLVSNCFKDLHKEEKSPYIGEVTNFLRSIVSVKLVPSFRVHGFPPEADEWIQRNRSWPNRGFINRATELEVYAIPEAIEIDRTKDIERSEDEVDAGLEPMQVELYQWSYDFSNLEACVMAAAGESWNRVLVNIMYLIASHGNASSPKWDRLVRSRFLWFMEKNNTEETSVNYTNQEQIFLREFIEDLQDGVLPHYFIREINLLKDLQEEEIHNFTDILLNITEMTDAEVKDAIDQHTDTEEAINRSDSIQEALKAHFQWCFDRLIELLSAQLHHQLHRGSISSSIKFHKELISSLDLIGPDESYTAPMKNKLRDSLGRMFHLKAGFAISREDRVFFTKEAKRILEISNKSDLCCLVSLVNFYFGQKKYQKVLDLIDIKDIQNDNRVFGRVEDRPTYTTRWRQQSYDFNIYYSSSEKPLLPNDIQACFRNLTSMLIGYSPDPVVSLNPRFILAYLYVMSKINLGDKTDVNDTLLFMEELSKKDQDDMNDKRRASYLYIIACCYFRMGDQAEGEKTLEKSVKILSNPQNPARWQLMKIRMGRPLWKMAVNGFFMVVAFVATSYTWKFVRNVWK